MDRTSKVDKKFKKAIRLLSAFEKDFPSEDSTLNSNIDRAVTTGREAKMSDRSESLSTALHALEKTLHANVKSSFVSLLLNADRF
jgi:hypothetical protein